MGQSPDANRIDPCVARIATAVQEAVAATRRRWTARALEREIAAREACPRTLVRRAIRRLIDAGRLEYSYTFGQSYLVLSFRQPVAVGERFVIISPDYKGRLAPERLPLVIGPGGAFGSGRHPTTRLALLALEKAWTLGPPKRSLGVPSVVDIGTGSGILAIAAARLGAVKVTALDIDPCARTEAALNVGLNAQTAAIAVVATPVKDLEGTFDAVIANLRPPTLIRLLAWISQHLSSDGRLVVSGMREEEWRPVAESFHSAGFQSQWQGCQGGWAGGFFCRQGGQRLAGTSSEG
jgi:ribosomal protein L11 methyltransferase